MRSTDAHTWLFSADSVMDHAVFGLPRVYVVANVLQLFRCSFGKHQRDRRAAWFDGSVWRSSCVGCKRPMYREFDGWHLSDGEPPPGIAHDHHR
ncbi:hypothetical protein DFR49_4049 [Hephaestia caeni]|uniref:Uncharacterized protein n=1 Tax=Hephaestia caeni TaxID=645617 RepID=A0A397NTL7_9SPHN|nr:hypothetical protein [Hephaestia caeni]RIA36761.1 hypothetical protein DFR49_4049 [Hephaestia caeni]